MSSNPVIKITGLSKCFRIYERPQDRLKQGIFGLLAKLLPTSSLKISLRQKALDCGRDFWALREIDFAVMPGETIGIIGRNGSGKSTLLQLICGTLTPTAGEVTVRGRVAALLELGSGFNSEFTGRENVFLNAQLLGLTRSQTSDRFDAIEKFADIGDFIDQPVKSYSSGMFLRLAFAVIAHVDADILIIDEALAVGDAYFTQKCMRFLHRFMEHGTVLFVSHDMASVKSLATRSVWLESGHLRMIGETRDIADEYLQALYAQDQSVERTTPSVTTDINTGNSEAIAPRIETTNDYRSERFADLGLLNHIEISRFNPNSDSFGNGDASIIDTYLKNKDGNILHGIHGGEWVCLEIKIRAHKALSSPIIGFFLRNRLGQNIFGDNSFFVNIDHPLQTPAGSALLGRFEFVMPFLPRGDYSFTVAIASGTNQEHVQHHWVYDAVIITSLSSNVHADILGIPMNHISLDPLSEPDGKTK